MPLPCGGESAKEIVTVSLLLLNTLVRPVVLVGNVLLSSATSDARSPSLSAHYHTYSTVSERRRTRARTGVSMSIAYRKPHCIGGFNNKTEQGGSLNVYRTRIARCRICTRPVRCCCCFEYDLAHGELGNRMSDWIMSGLSSFPESVCAERSDNTTIVLLRNTIIQSKCKPRYVYWRSDKWNVGQNLETADLASQLTLSTVNYIWHRCMSITGGRQ